MAIEKLREMGDRVGGALVDGNDVGVTVDKPLVRDAPGEPECARPIVAVERNDGVWRFAEVLQQRLVAALVVQEDDPLVTGALKPRDELPGDPAPGRDSLCRSGCQSRVSK